MSNLKDELIKIGSENPSLQKHLRPIISTLENSNRRTANEDLVRKRAVMTYSTDQPIDDRVKRDDLYDFILSERGNLANAASWKKELEQGPEIFMEMGRSEGRYGGEQGEIYVSVLFDSSMTYQTLETGTQDSFDEAAQSVASGVRIDLMKVFSDKGIEIDRNSIRVVK